MKTYNRPSEIFHLPAREKEILATSGELVRAGKYIYRLKKYDGPAIDAISGREYHVVDYHLCKMVKGEK